MTDHPFNEHRDGLRYVPVDGRDWRLAMGLRPLEPARWFEFGRDAGSQLVEKTRLLHENPDGVVALLDECDDASAELLAMIQGNLATFHPDRLNTVDKGEHPLIAASRLVPDDLCVMLCSDNEWRLVGASVCFPSRWALADKIGTTLDEIHDPVPGYDEQLATPTRAYFDRMRPDRPMWRLNWTLLDSAELFQPHGGDERFLDDPNVWQFRVERQTLSQLSESGAVIFTIRTYVSSAREMVDSVEGFAQNVLVALRSAPDATLQYKGWQNLASAWGRWFS